jgi:hypothetical protein
LEAKDIMLRQPRRRESRTATYHRHWFLVHRGADPRVIAEIVGALEANNQTVTVQDHDGSSMPLAAFRAFVSRQIDEGHRYFIVLLNEHLTGPIYRQTFSPIRKKVGYEISFCEMRIEDCDIEGAEPVMVDLANLDDADTRRRQIVSICPTDRARCCGRAA